MINEPQIIVYGAGAIGASLAGWLAPHCPGLAVAARGEHARVMESRGLTLYMKNTPDAKQLVRLTVIEDTASMEEADIVVLAVKNYDLEEAAVSVRAALGDRPAVVGLQNGLLNQEILPRYFSKVVYGVVCYNAWRDAPGVIGAEKRGPILLGALGGDGAPGGTLAEINAIFSKGIDSRIEPDIAGAARCKLLMNLSNSIFTLVGHGVRPIESVRALKKLVLAVLLEGIDILTGAGYREVRLPGMSGWKLIRLASLLPEFVSDKIFEGDFQKIGMNSMGQDILLNHKDVTELDSLNGYFIGLADRLGLEAPLNRALYNLCREQFARRPFAPMPESLVWERLAGRP